MLLNVALIAGAITKSFLSSLKGSSATLKKLATDEAHKLAMSLATIGQMLADGDVDQDEAEALIEVQKSATEAVFSSLEGVGRVAARNATRAGLSSVVSVVDGAIGLPLVATLIGQAAPQA